MKRPLPWLCLACVACSSTVDVQLPQDEVFASFGVFVDGPAPRLQALNAFRDDEPGVLLPLEDEERLFVTTWPLALSDYDLEAKTYDAEKECDGGRTPPPPRAVFEKIGDRFEPAERVPETYRTFRLPDVRVAACAANDRCLVGGPSDPRCDSPCGAQPNPTAPELPMPPNVVVPPECPGAGVAFVGETVCAPLDICGPGPFAPNLPADAIYVDPAASNGDGSIGTPLPTLAQALARATPGAVVALGPGIHVGPTVRVTNDVHLVGTCTATTTLTVPIEVATASITIEGVTLTGTPRAVVLENAGALLRNVRAIGTRIIDATDSDTTLERVVATDGDSVVRRQGAGTTTVDRLLAVGLEHAAFVGDDTGGRGTMVVQRTLVRDSAAFLTTSGLQIELQESVGRNLDGPLITANRVASLIDVDADGAGIQDGWAAALWLSADSRSDDRRRVTLERVALRNLRGQGLRLQSGAKLTDVTMSGVTEAMPQVGVLAGIELHDSDPFEFERILIEDIAGHAIGARCDDNGPAGFGGLVDVTSLTVRRVDVGFCVRSRRIELDRFLAEDVRIAVQSNEGVAVTITDGVIRDWREAAVVVGSGSFVGRVVRFLGGGGAAIRVDVPRPPATVRGVELQNFEIDGADVGLDVKAPDVPRNALTAVEGVIRNTPVAASLACGYSASAIFSGVEIDERAEVRHVE